MKILLALLLLALPAFAQEDRGLISLDFEDITLNQAIQFILRAHPEIRLVTGEKLEDHVTVKFTDVPWRQALESLLRAHDYALYEDGELLRIEKVTDAEESAKGELVTQQFQLSYVDGYDLLPYLRELLSAQGKVTCFAPEQRDRYLVGGDITADVRALGGAEGTNVRRGRARILSITDHPDIVKSIGERIRALDNKPHQVEVNVKVIQLERGKGSKFGVDWSTVLSFTGATRPTNLPWGPHGNKFMPEFPAPPASTFTFGSLAADQLTAILRLIEEDDGAEIISEPNITTLDNIEASILIGTKFPLTRETIDPQTAVRTVTLDRYQDIGIRLLVIPTITDGDHLHMVIHPTVSSFTDLIEDRFPIINTREADTQMLLRSGETAVIGGLIEKNDREQERRVPFLGSIPILGWLFRYRETSDSSTELVFFVTPRIVLGTAEIEQSLMIDDKRRALLEEMEKHVETLLDE